MYIHYCYMSLSRSTTLELSLVLWDIVFVLTLPWYYAKGFWVLSAKLSLSIQQFIEIKVSMILFIRKLRWHRESTFLRNFGALKYELVIIWHVEGEGSKIRAKSLNLFANLAKKEWERISDLWRNCREKTPDKIFITLTHNMPKIQRKNLLLACSALSSRLWWKPQTSLVSPKGHLWKLKGKDVLLTKLANENRKRTPLYNLKCLFTRSPWRLRQEVELRYRPPWSKRISCIVWPGFLSTSCQQEHSWGVEK